MFKTPPIPDSIRNLPAPSSFANPFQMGIEGPTLFGTETLCGDWDGDLLLLAQDFAPAEEVEQVIKRYGSQKAWRHNDGDGRYGIGLTTNQNICRHLNSIGRDISIDGQNSTNCGVLYGNASFFLKRGSISTRNGTRASKVIFEFVLKNMPHLKAIACLGKESFDGTMNWLNRHANWRTCLDTRASISSKGLRIFALSHPGQLGINGRVRGATNTERSAAIEADWQAIGQYLSSNELSD